MTKIPKNRRNTIHVIHGHDPVAMAKQLLEAAEASAAIPQGAVVALKPNLVVAKPASQGATTHPGIVAGIIEYLLDHGRKTIEIIESSWLGDDTGRAFTVCGITDIAKRYGVPLYDLKRDEVLPKSTPLGEIQVCRRAWAADFLINLPVLKGHCQTRMTCAIKNMKGCIPDDEKRRFHREGLDNWIAAMATVLRPQLTVVDGICGDLDFEEGGNPVPADRMFLGWDPVKLDVFGCSLMGLAPEAVGYLPLAAQHGVGDMTLAPGDVVYLNRPGAKIMNAGAGKVARLGKGVAADQACSACYANLIHALQRLRENRTTGSFPPLAIGQGWKGREAPGWGIGDCCRGRLGNVPGCPPSATAIREALERTGSGLNSSARPE